MYLSKSCLAIFICTGLFSSFSWGTEELQPHFQSAGCLIRTDTQVLLVRDLWSKKLGYPGGWREGNESPEDTALRELREETGLEGRALRPIAQFEDFVLLSCTAEATLTGAPAFQRQTKIAGMIRLRFIPKDPREVEDVFLVEPSALKKKYLRFPSQYSSLENLFYQVPVSKLNLVDDVKKPESWFLQRNLELTQGISRLRPPWLISIMRALTYLGDEESLILLCLLIWALFSRKFGYQTVVALCVGLWVNSLLKGWIHEYRPPEFDPSVQLTKAVGWSCPSGHAQIAALFWGLIAYRIQRKKVIVMCMTVAFLVGLSRVVLGAHFASDVLCGWIAGAAMVWIFTSKNIESRIFRLREQPWKGVLAILLVSCVVLLARFHPETVAVSCALLGLFTGLAISRENVHVIEHTPSSKEIAVRVGVLGLLLIVFRLVYKEIEPAQATFAASLGYHSMKYFVIGFSFPIFSHVARFVSKKNATQT